MMNWKGFRRKLLSPVEVLSCHLFGGTEITMKYVREVEIRIVSLPNTRVER
jgi:hypothetical protein